MRVRSFGFGVAAIAVAACGGGVDGSELFADAGASTETGSPGKDAADTGTTSPPIFVGGDSGGPTPKDDATTIPPTMDATVTPVPEASVPPIDTGTPMPTTPVIACTNGDCTGGTPVCCITETQQGANGTCVASTAACSGFGTVPVACEQQTDCNGGEICCADLAMYGVQTYPKSLTCEASCSGQGQARVCTVGANDCPSGETCNAFEGTPFGACGQ